MSRHHRRLAAFTLAAVLVTPAAWAHAPQGKGPSSASPGTASLLLSFLAGWGGLGLPGAWFMEGCMVDPAGRCIPKTTTKNGCLVDPAGQCLPNATADNGCLIDPAGHCAPGH